MIPSKVLSSLGLLTIVRASLAFQNCPPFGPDFPKLTSLSTSSGYLQGAFANLTLSLIQLVNTSNSSYGPVDASANSFSIQVFSAQVPTPLFESHHTATDLPLLNSSGVTAVDSNTVYRIGSLTKLFTVYAFLVEAGDVLFNQPVIKYVPELASLAVNMSTNALNDVLWAEVTVGELTSQLAGIGRDSTELGELELTSDFVPTQYGLPPINSSEVPSCGIDPLCSRAAFFSNFAEHHPVYPTSSTPIYSNVAFQILSYALENITGKDFPSIIQDSIFTPLNLTRTSYTGPVNDSLGIIPGDDLSTFWTVDLGDEGPAGGFYSSVSDISSVGRSILKSTLLSPAQTRRWMKPKSHTADPLQSVGSPWEIQRIQLQNPSRILDAYTKAGDVGAYSSYLILLPDYDLGFSILVAGAESAASLAVLGDLIGDIVIPAAEATARQQAQASYAGYYSSNSGINSSLTIATSQASLGLEVTQWISNGTNMFSAIASLLGVTPVIHLFPTQLKVAGPDGSMLETFRAVFEDAAAPLVIGSFEQNCVSWEGVDGFHYEHVSLDEFLFQVGPNGEVESIAPRAFQVTLNKS